MARAVPYAADAQGALVDPAQVRGSGPFTCLECGEIVSLRREHVRQGRAVVAHFSHQPGSVCAGESVLHIAAKMRLCEALTRQEQPFVIRRVCQRFACEATEDVPWTLPLFDAAEVEVPLGAYRLDVAALSNGEVAVGFEVFFTHRVDTMKAAGLDIPWMELQAEATARDPYVLQPVVNSRLTADEESRVRFGLRTTRAELPQQLQERMALGCMLDTRVNGRAVPTHLVNQVFEGRREGVSFLSPWWCPACAAAHEQHVRAALAAQRDLDHRAREQAQRAEREEQERVRQHAARLAEQQQIFGPGLRRPVLPGLVPDMRKQAPVLRAVSRYLHLYWPGAGGQIQLWRGEILVARRCWKCQQAIVCLDARGLVPNFKAFYPMVEYFRPPESRRGYFVSKCLACGERQRVREVRQGGHVVLRDDLFPRWVEAFDGLAQAATKPDVQMG